MATAKEVIRLSRFVDVDKESRKLLQPIEGYQSLPLVTLEEAIEPIVEFCPDVRRRAYIAKGNCDSSKDGLTEDESASIILYTTEWSPRDQCLYVVLNSMLRSKNRMQLIPSWFPYMKLLLTALFKLPSYIMTVWRGVRLDLRNDYEVGKTYTWWGFSSCTESLSVLTSNLFLGQEGKRTMFSIECFNGKRIHDYSSFKNEDEILLLPGSQFIVKSHLEPSKKDPDLIIIQLKQVEPPHTLLEEPSQGMVSFGHTSKPQIFTKEVPHHSKTEVNVDLSAILARVKFDKAESNPRHATDESPAKISVAAKDKRQPDDQEFAPPGKYKELYQTHLCLMWPLINIIF